MALCRPRSHAQDLAPRKCVRDPWGKQGESKTDKFAAQAEHDEKCRIAMR